MKPSLVSWNSLTINNGNPFTSSIPPGSMANIAANAVTVPRAGEYPFLSTNVQTSHVFVIEVYIAAGQNLNTNRELLKKYFNIGDPVRHNLVIQDENDSNRQYYLTGFVVGVSPQGRDTPNAFNVRFAVEFPYWQLVTASSDSWEITASGDSDLITNIGNIAVPPKFTITPTVTKTAGLKYRRYVPIYNNLDRSFVAPLDITNGGLDVQALVNANRMQADGDDFRVWRDGAFADRWLYEMDSDSDPALAWVNYDLAPRREGTISATFDSDDTTMSFSQTRDNLAFLRALLTVPNTTLLVESEAVTFDPDNIDLGDYQITGLTRGEKNTTAVSHASGVTVRFIEHDLWILYGDSDATAPDVDDRYKPVFDLSSTNAAWSYTNYFDADSFRSGSWRGEVLASRTGLSYTYTAPENTFVDPSTSLGLALVGSADFQVQNESGTLAWTISHPAGMTDVDYSVSKYMSGSWPAIVGLQYLQPNTVWFTADLITAPSITYNWEDSGPLSIPLGGTYETIRFCIDGLLSSTISEMALAEFDTVTLSFDSDNLPTVSVGTEAEINFFDFTLTNVTTGESIKVQTPCPLNTDLIIDCANKEAYLEDGTRVRVTLSSDRDAWLDLASGVNALTWTDVGTAGVTVMVEHRDRVL